MFSLSRSRDNKFTVNDKTFKVNLSFRRVLRVMEMFEDEMLNDEEKIAIAFNILVEDTKTSDISLLDASLLVNQVFSSLKREDASTSELKVFDWQEDAERIYSSFLQDYNIDLLDEDLDWFKFTALFNNLSDETPIMTAIKYRSMPLPKDREERKFVKKMKEFYKLESNRKIEEDIMARRMAKLFE